MAKRGKFCQVFVGGAVIAVLSLLFQSESEECGALRRTLLAQQDMDLHREGPIDFPYVSLSLVASCGEMALRMPHPYKIRIATEKTEADLQRELFALKKPTVRVRDIRPFNESVEKLLAGGIGGFTENVDSELPFQDAKGCLGNATCAMFFDNSWTFEDIKPMIPTTPGGIFESLLEHTRFGNMFCTNLSQSRMTARLHSAPYHGSIAIQLAGIKRWKFWNPSALKEWGVQPDEQTFGRIVSSIFTVFAGMSEVMHKIPHYDVVTQPGEFMYFPSHWTHAVWTDAGWNNMINLRMCFTVRSLFLSALNAMKVHKAAGVCRLFFCNVVQTLYPDEVFLKKIAGSRDRSRTDPGNDVITDYINQFIQLNMKVM